MPSPTCCYKHCEHIPVMQCLCRPLTQQVVLNIGHQTSEEISDDPVGPFINIHEGILGFPPVRQSLC